MSATNANVAAPSSGKGLNIALWVVQVLLALVFLMSGAMKLVSSGEELAKHGNELALPLVRFIGVAEITGALGMLIPALTRIKPRLTGWAGVGLATIMVLASGFHVMKGDVAHLPVPLVLLAMAAFVAWGRLVKAPIASR